MISNQAIDPYVCPYGHHAVELGVTTFKCETCRKHGRNSQIHKSKLLDLRTMPEPNMSVSAMRRWKNSEAYQDYKSYRDSQKYAGYTDTVTKRTIRVIQNQASQADAKKVKAFIARHKSQRAGKARFGSGSDAVSAHTAALRNWGYDPTGRYT